VRNGTNRTDETDGLGGRGEDRSERAGDPPVAVWGPPAVDCLRGIRLSVSVFIVFGLGL